MACAARRGVSALIVLALWAPAVCAEVKLAGSWERRTDADTRRVLGDAVCFHPDEKFESALPRPAGDERRAWFCFSNRAQAMKAFGVPAFGKGCGSRGTATVTVSGYSLGKGEEAVDRARLERVLAKTPPRPIPCNE